MESSEVELAIAGLGAGMEFRFAIFAHYLCFAAAAVRVMKLRLKIQKNSYYYIIDFKLFFQSWTLHTKEQYLLYILYCILYLQVYTYYL